MPELTPSTRELARRIGVTETALRKAAAKGRIEREPDGQWNVAKTRRRMIETADPVRSPLAGAIGAGTTQAGLSGDATPYARLRVAQLALKVEAQRMALDEDKRRLLDAVTANAAIDEIAGAMRDARLNWPARVSGLIAAHRFDRPTLAIEARTRNLGSSRKTLLNALWHAIGVSPPAPGDPSADKRGSP